MFLNGLTIEKKNGSLCFIPYSSISRIIVEPNTDWRERKVRIYGLWFESQHYLEKTGKWDLVIEAIGGITNRITYDTKEIADRRKDSIISGEIFLALKE